jgi:GNAT superfamily N-acetyltransferase
MTTPTPVAGIRAATPDDLDALTSVLLDAFLTGRLADWLVADVTERRAVYGRCFPLVLGHALAAGEVDMIGDGSAVAIWLPVIEPGLADEPGEYELRLAEAVGPHLDRFVMKMTACEARHPAVSHDYLAYLGVTPERQGTGLGSALLDHHHARLDAAGVPAYLEATNERNRDLYLRHGYTTPGPIDLPDGGPPMWGMWREPASTPMS